MNVNSFQDRENVDPVQELTKHCRVLPALLSIAKQYQAFPSIAKYIHALPWINSFFNWLNIEHILQFESSIVKIIENKANFSTLVHPSSTSTFSEIMEKENF